MQRYRINSIQQNKIENNFNIVMNFIERLQYYMAQNDINDNKITVDAGLSVGLIGKAKKSGKAMNSANIEKILLAYPDLNPEWLLTGKGEMLKTNGSSKAKLTQQSTDNHHKITKNKPDTQDYPQETRPRIPLEAAAGSLSIALGSATRDDCEQIPIIPTFPKYDFTILARGNSMEPQYLSGDELACLFVTDSSFIQWGRAHVLDTTQGIVVKRIFDNGDTIICKSNNPAFPDFNIPKSDILRMALVVGYIRIE